MGNIQGYSFVGKREDFDTDLKIEKIHVTVGRLGTNKAGLDSMAYGLYRHTVAAVVEAGSTDSIINLTGHVAKVGDVVRVKTSANAIEELDIVVKEVTANTITLDGVASALFATGDTFDILRPIPQRYDADGTSLAATLPVQINVTSGAVTTATTILDDLDTPVNTVPMPVRIYGFSGAINITADEINVQLSHSGGTPDSTQVGDGTTIWGIKPVTKEGLVHDADSLAQLVLLVAKDFATETTLAALNAKFGSLGQKAMAGSAPVVIASDQAAIPISTISGAITLPTGASTEAKQDNAITQLTTIAGKDFATQTTLTALNAKFSSLGQKASAASTSMVLSTEQEVIIAAIQTAVELIDNCVSGTEMQVDLVDLGGAATEATLAAQSAKLPASLGQKNSAASMSVVLASDFSMSISHLDIKAFIQHKFVTTNVDDTAYVELLASIGAAAGKKVRIFYAGGEPMYLAEGAAAAEVNQMIIWPGMDAEIELSLAAASRLSLKAVNASTTIASGVLIINVMG